MTEVIKNDLGEAVRLLTKQLRQIAIYKCQFDLNISISLDRTMHEGAFCPFFVRWGSTKSVFRISPVLFKTQSPQYLCFMILHCILLYSF